MGSRIHREVYVRFRGEAMETYHGDMKRRCSLSYNIQREELLPSEKAFAFKMKMDVIKRQGNRLDLTSDQNGPKLAAWEKKLLLVRLLQG